MERIIVNARSHNQLTEFDQYLLLQTKIKLKKFMTEEEKLRYSELRKRYDE